MEEKQLQTIETSVYFKPEIWSVIKQMAEVFIKSGALSVDVKNAPQLMMKLQAGYELGMQPIESMNSLYIVGGRITMWGEAVLGRLRKFNYKLTYIESTDIICKVKVTAPDGEEFFDEATYADAEKSGWTKDKFGKLKFNYKCPKNKLRYNAIRTLIKFNCPEILGSIDIKEAADDYVELKEKTDAYIEAEIAIAEMKKEPKKALPTEVKIGEEPKMKINQKPEKEIPREVKTKPVPEVGKAKDFLIKEIAEIAEKIIKQRAIKEEREFNEKDVVSFVESGADKLFGANRISDLDVKELEHYVNTLTIALKKDEK